MRALVVGGVLALCGAAAGAEVRRCDVPLLLDMSAEILARRSALDGFAPGHFGGAAGYLMLRYGDMAPEAVFAALREGRAYRQVDEMALAHRIATLGPAGVDRWGIDPAEALIGSGLAVRRAILLLDDGETFFGIIDRIAADPGLDARFREAWLDGAGLHAVLTDQPPAVLGAIAARAEARGELQVAGSLYALMPEGAYEAFWDRHRAAAEGPARLAAPRNMNTNGTAALARVAPLADPGAAADMEVLLDRQRQFLVLRAGLHEGGSTLLPIVAHQTGRMAEAAVIAEAYLAALQTGGIDPLRRPGEAWAFLLAALVERFGAPDAVRVLSSFDFSADRRHYAGRALDVLELATLAEAAGPWLRGETGAPPDRPDALSADFDWTLAVTILALVRDGATIPEAALAGAGARIAVEGHLQRGEAGAALALAERAGGLAGRLGVARDLLHRQNRLCDRHGILPGAPLLLGGQMVYDFQ